MTVPDPSRLRQRYCSKTGPVGHEQQRNMTPEEWDTTFERVPLVGGAAGPFGHGPPPTHDVYGGRLVSGPDKPDTGGVSVLWCLICGGYMMERELK